MNIDLLLKDVGVNKTTLAARLGVAKQSISGLLRNPTEKTLQRIADALGVPMWQLFAPPAHPEPEPLRTQSLRIRELCDAAGITMRDLSLRAALSETSVLKAANRDGSVETLDKIAQALGVPVAALFQNHDTASVSCPECGKSFSVKVTPI